MNIKFRVEKGKIVENANIISDAFAILNDGWYILQVSPVSLSSPRDCQNAYFAMVDIVVQHTGHSRYEIHEMFKTEEGIASTKDLPVEEWRRILDRFRWWAFVILDCIV